MAASRCCGAAALRAFGLISCALAEAEGAEWSINEACLVLGGAAPHTCLAHRAASALQGQPWSQQTLQLGLKALAEDLQTVSACSGLLLVQASAHTFLSNSYLESCGWLGTLSVLTLLFSLHA